MARVGAFSGTTFMFGTPLLSVHPIDNKFPEPERDDDKGEVQPVDDDAEKRDK